MPNDFYCKIYVTPYFTYTLDPKVLYLGLIQSLFEGSMYIFVLEWTPALTPGKMFRFQVTWMPGDFCTHKNIFRGRNSHKLTR